VKASEIFSRNNATNILISIVANGICSAAVSTWAIFTTLPAWKLISLLILCILGWLAHSLYLYSKLRNCVKDELTGCLNYAKSFEGEIATLNQKRQSNSKPDSYGLLIVEVEPLSRLLNDKKYDKSYIENIIKSIAKSLRPRDQHELMFYRPPDQFFITTKLGVSDADIDGFIERLKSNYIKEHTVKKNSTKKAHIKLIIGGLIIVNELSFYEIDKKLQAILNEARNSEKLSSFTSSS
jgi:hypothetical protein